MLISGGNNKLRDGNIDVRSDESKIYKRQEGGQKNRSKKEKIDPPKKSKKTLHP